MRELCFFMFVLLISSVAMGQSSQPLAPQTVEISSGTLDLKAFLWKPTGPGPFPAVLFNHGSGGADAAHTAGMQITEAAEKLAPLFLKHGYAFLYLFRRGQGLSADQAPFKNPRNLAARSSISSTQTVRSYGFVKGIAVRRREMQSWRLAQ